MGYATTALLPQAEALTVQRLRVQVEAGPNAGTGVDSDAEPLRIGTLDGCSVRLSDPTVSGVHLELSRTKQGIVVRDTGSKNGTFIGPVRIQHAVVNRPTRLRLGETEILVTPLAETSPIAISAAARFGDMVGESVAIRRLFAQLEQLAPTDSTVLLSGETGVGKELAAEAIKDHSRRRNGPFVVVDCGALPTNLVQSELLGHERGAFTGADRARAGAFERADGGTLFLDEIGELPLELQPALLGVLERRAAKRVGGDQPLSFDVRIIAATNRSLADEVERGAFRADLYYRLALVEVRLPPLRARKDDIGLLVQHFADEFGAPWPALSDDALKELRDYPWPGNLRELKNLVERALVMNEPLSPGRWQKPPPADPGAPDIDYDSSFKEAKRKWVDNFERAYLKKILADANGNISLAARKARIDRGHLHKLLERHQPDPPLGSG